MSPHHQPGQQRRHHDWRRTHRGTGIPRLLTRPLMGGIFQGRYSLASVPTVERGLHAIRFMVIEPRAGQVLAHGADKVEVMAQARQVLEDSTRQSVLFPDQPEREGGRQRHPRPRMSPRRREEVFARSGACCHYCAAPLYLHGPWHVDHQQPLVMGGSEDPMNLVAACTSCNLAKGAQTAVEFVAGAPR